MLSGDIIVALSEEADGVDGLVSVIVYVIQLQAELKAVL